MTSQDRAKRIKEWKYGTRVRTRAWKFDMPGWEAREARREAMIAQCKKHGQWPTESQPAYCCEVVENKG